MNISDVLRQEAKSVGETGGDFLPLPWEQFTHPETLAELLPDSHHAVMSIWNFALPDERALTFLGPKDEARKQRIRADLIHQLFPRATLLMERHRNASSNSEDFSRLSIEVDGDHDKYVRWTRRWPRARVVLSKVCWNELLPPRFLDVFEDTVSRLKEILEGAPERNWHHVVDAGRTLREGFANWLHFCRRCLGNQAGEGLLAAVGAMADVQQVKKRRQREFPEVSKELLDSNDITWFVDSETIDDFLCLLQALRCYMGDNRHLVSWLYKASPHQALGVLAIAKNVTKLSGARRLGRKTLEDFYRNFLTNNNEAIRKQREQQAKLTSDHRREPGPPEAIQSEVDGWLDTPDLEKGCARRLVALAKELAEKHCVHEGRQLRYRFVYASSASLWPEIEEVLSFEAASDHSGGNDQTIDELATSLDAHWSIFQPERVFGVIDTLPKGLRDQPRIQRVVRIRPPTKWSGLESEAMDGLAGATEGPCLVVVVLRQWMVRLSFALNDVTPKTLLWDVRRDTPELLVSLKDLAKSLAEVTEIDDARVLNAIATTLSEISEAPGEGALLVAVGDGNVQEIVKRTCMEMDGPDSRMAWRSNKQLRWVDRTLLRAMLILDGATVIHPNANRGTIVRPRLVVYPFTFCKEHPSEGFSVVSWTSPQTVVDGCTCPKPEEVLLGRVRKKLVGKGSRKHGGANIAVLLQHANGKSSVVSVSADGPIEKWP